MSSRSSAVLPSRRNAATRRALRALIGVVLLSGGLRAAPAFGYASSLDPTFGVGGIVRRDLEGDWRAEAIAFDSQDRILVAGTWCEVGFLRCRMIALRFDDRGEIAGPFGLGFAYSEFAASYAVATSMALDREGRIVVAGYVQENSGFTPGDPRYSQAQPGTSRFAVARFTPDGAWDRSFGGTGMVTTDVSPGGDQRAEDVVIDDDGGIVVAGWSDRGGNRDMVLVRYLDDGNLDPSYGNAHGLQYFGAEDSNEAGKAMAIDRLGRVVVAGDKEGVGIVVARFERDGTPDRWFGEHPLSAEITFELQQTRVTSLAIDLTDRIVVVSNDDGGSAVTRFMPDGDRVDDSFNDDGVGIFGSPLNPLDEDFAVNYEAAFIDRSNRVVLAGTSNFNRHGIVQRLDARGFKDSRGTGEETEDRWGSAEGLRAHLDSVVAWQGLAVDRYSRVVAVGYDRGSPADPEVGSRFVLARYNGEPFVARSAAISCPTCPEAMPALCGNGYFEFTEQCDDGNTTPGDGCSDTCTAELDLDADGLLDPADACVNAGGLRDFAADPSARITVARGASAETLDLSAVFPMDSGWRFADFDPNVDPYLDARGFVQLVVANGYPSQILDVRVGDDGPDRVWTRTSDTEWRYENRIPDDASPVLSMVIRDEGEGRVGVTAQARKSAFTGSAGSSLEVPLRASVTLGRGDGAGQHGECGESRFVAADCGWNAAGTALTCQPGGAAPKQPVCGFGAEIALVMPLLAAWRRRRAEGARAGR